MGWCSWQRFKCNHQFRMIVITAYQVSQTHSTGLGQDLTAVKSRGIKSRNKVYVQKYITLVHQSLRNMTSSSKQETDKIDIKVTKAALHEEKKVSKANYGYGWFQTLATSGKNVTFWRNCIRIFKSG